MELGFKVKILKNKNEKTMLHISDFPQATGIDYWDGLMFIALPYETYNSYYYKGNKSERYDLVDEIEIIFTEKQPNKRAIINILNSINKFLKNERD